MNFIVDKKKNKVGYVHIHVHSKKIIVRIDGNNNLYEHEQYNKVLVDLERYFKPEKLKYIEGYLRDNLELIGIIMNKREEKKKTNDNDQLSLF